MTELALAVDATDELWTLDALPTPEAPYVEVEDELIEVRSRFPSSYYTLTGETLPPRIRVRRGIAGTTKASHVQGSTLTPNYGLGSGGGGGAIAVTDGTTTVEDVTELLVAGGTVTDEGAGVAGVAVQNRLLGPYIVNWNDAGLGTDNGLVIGPSIAAGVIAIRMWAEVPIAWVGLTAPVVLAFGHPTAVFVELAQISPTAVTVETNTAAGVNPAGENPESTPARAVSANCRLMVACYDAVSAGRLNVYALIAVPA